MADDDWKVVSKHDVNDGWIPLGKTSGKVPEQTPMGGAERFMTGMGDPVIGAQQLYAHIAETPEKAAKVDLAVKMREADIARREGGGLMRGLGAAATMAPLAAAAPLGGLAGATASGAVMGALQPTPQSGANYWDQKTEDALFGAAFGGGGRLLGVLAGPQLREPAQALVAQGVKLTPGQMSGGILRRAEEAFKSLPVLGSFIRGAESRGIEGFNKAVLNQALEPIGAKLDPKSVAGREAIGETRKKISAAYDTLLPNLRLSLDRDLANDIANVRFLANELPKPIREQFNGILQNRLGDVFRQKGPILAGDELKKAESALRALGDSYRSSSDPAQRQLAARLDDVRGVLRDSLIRQNPNAADLLGKIDQAYAMFARAEGAAARRATSSGIFTPNDLLQTIKSQDKTVRKGAFARGDALMQEFAEYGQQVLPGKLPDSGTTERALYDAALLGSAVGAETGHMPPEIAITLGAGALPYTRPGMAVINALAQPGPTRARAAMLARGAASVSPPVAQQERTYGGPSD